MSSGQLWTFSVIKIYHDNLINRFFYTIKWVLSGLYLGGYVTWKAKSWYFCFSLGPSAYHHSPRILLTVRLSWFGWRWWTKARCRLLNIMNAFIGRLMWSLSFSYTRERTVKIHALKLYMAAIIQIIYIYYVTLHQ